MTRFGPSLKIGSFDPGCILYLRSEEEVDGLDLDDVVVPRVKKGIKGCLGHPCVVIKKCAPISPSSNDMIQICPMTSFRGNSLQARFRGNKSWWASYLPVEPSPLNPQHPGILLRLADTVTMRKAGYVKVGETWEVHLSMLDLYDQKRSARHYRLDKPSFKHVLKAVASSMARAYPIITPPTSPSDTPLGSHRAPRQVISTSVRTPLIQSPQPAQASSYSAKSSSSLDDACHDRQVAHNAPGCGTFTRAQDLEGQTSWAIPRHCCNSTPTLLKLLLFSVLLLSLGLVWGNYVFF